MKIIFAWLTLSAVALSFAEEKPLDFWDEEIRLFGIAATDQHVDASLHQRRDSSYKTKGFALDHADKVEGDLSVVYLPAAVGLPKRFGFVSSLWGEPWELSPEMTLRLWTKTGGKKATARWKVSLVDGAGREAVGVLEGMGAEWRELRLPLSKLRAPQGFDWAAVKLCEFEAEVSADTRIHFDGVRFEGKGSAIGVTDKTVAQRRQEAERTRASRTEEAFRQVSDEDSGGTPVVSAFAKMWLNEDLETANRLLVEELKKSSDGNAWSLLHTPLYCRFYYLFSNRVGKHPGRMTQATEKLLLETLWERTASKNDIHWARQSTWWLDGSENHDLNAKACNLVTARIFMNEPEYQNRIYLDYGFGGGYHYGHAGYYGPGIDPDTRHGGGRANLADGQEYNAADHYTAWLTYLKTYFRERAERGFFLEYGSLTYSKHSLNMVDLAYQYCGDKELKGIVDDFLTLYWAEWAQVSISGVRGGPKTRHHSTVQEGTGTSALISFYLGGPAAAGPWWYWNLINDYELPAIVWAMALDRQGMGSFTYRARGIGEEEAELPRPLGTERSMVVDTEARFLKSTYVTPDYTLGTQMDHPLAVHSHLSIAGRWHGMTFAQSPEARIVAVGITEGANVKGDKSAYDLETMYQTVQHERTLIVQQARRWTAVHPEWFPSNIEYDVPVGIWFGNQWDRRLEKNGWIFVQKGNAYAAVRPVLWDEAYEKAQLIKTTGNQKFFNAPDDAPTVKLRTDCYRWNKDNSILLYDDNHTATIIEAGSKADYATLETFMDDVLDNPIALYKTVVPGTNILVYAGSGENAPEIVFNCGSPEIPTVGGKPINYRYPMTFDSPYLKSEYKSGIVKISKDDRELILDFNE